MRNGIQDYEYFWMLENKVMSLKDSLGKRFSWINPKQRGKEIAGYVVQGFADQSDDPEILLNAKMQLIRELVEFNSSPGIYVQTNPLEGTLITSGSTIEVFGWTEPGTTIVVNGQQLPVSNQGLFLEQFKLSKERNKIIIKATGLKGSKDIIRVFPVR
jgi:hypothetical protein